MDTARDTLNPQFQAQDMVPHHAPASPLEVVGLDVSTKNTVMIPLLEMALQALEISREVLKMKDFTIDTKNSNLSYITIKTRNSSVEESMNIAYVTFQNLMLWQMNMSQTMSHDYLTLSNL